MLLLTERDFACRLAAQASLWPAADCIMSVCYDAASLTLVAKLM